MLGRVLQKLRYHHGQRGGDRGLELPRFAVVVDADRPVRTAHVLRQADQGGQDVVEVDLVSGVAREDLVHHGNRTDPPL